MSAGECDSLTSPGLVSSSSSSQSGEGIFDEPFSAESQGGSYHHHHRWLTGLAPKASDIYKLHWAAQMALQGTDIQMDAAGAGGHATLQEGARPTASQLQGPSSTCNYTPDFSKVSPWSPWLRRHPILGPWLGMELEVERSDTEIVFKDVAVSPRPDDSPLSPKASFRAPSEAAEGARAADAEILKLLNELLKGQQEAKEKEAIGATKAAELAALEAAKLAKRAAQATRKQQLSVSTFLALGVKDTRLLLLDCFLAWSGERSRAPRTKAPEEKSETKEATAQVCSEDERPSLLQVETIQVSRRVPAGNGPVPPILPGTLRALPGEEVYLGDDGSIRGASLLLSMRPPRAIRPFLRSFDICTEPWAEVKQEFAKPSQEVSIQTSPKGIEPKEGLPQFLEADDLTPEQVLRRIQGLQKEMTEMETSLDQLRQDFEAPEEALDGREVPQLKSIKEAVVEASFPPHPPPKRLSRLRQRLPESLAWLEEAARTAPSRSRHRSRPGLPRT